MSFVTKDITNYRDSDNWGSPQDSEEEDEVVEDVEVDPNRANEEQSTTLEESEEEEVVNLFQNLSLDEQDHFDIGLEHLPLEILQNIIKYDDGSGTLALKETSSILKAKVEGCLEKIAGWKFWRNKCYFHIERDLLKRILTSYDNLATRGEDLTQMRTPRVDKRYCFTWEDVYKVKHSLKDLLMNGRIGTHRMTRIEKLIKDEIMICYPEAQRPLRITRSFGSLLLNVNSPPPNRVHLDSMVVFEDMEEVRRTMDIECRFREEMEHEAVSYINVELMLITDFEKPTDNPAPPLPGIGRILIFSCRLCLNLVPLQNGTSFHIPIRGPYLDEDGTTLDPFIWTNKNDLFFWYGGPTISHFHISQTPTGDIIAKELKTLQFQNMATSWYMLEVHRNEYMPIARRVNGEEHDDIILEFVSPLKGKMVLNPRQSILPNQLPRITTTRITRYNEINGTWIQENFWPLLGHSERSGVCIFWSYCAFAISWADSKYLKWAYDTWENVASIKSMICKEDAIPIVEIISEDMFIMGKSEEIVILGAKKVNQVQENGNIVEQINFELLRRIDVLFPHLEMPELDVIMHISFDYEAGHPYIFLICDDPDSEEFHSFSLIKMLIGVEEEEAKEEDSGWDE